MRGGYRDAEGLSDACKYWRRKYSDVLSIGRKKDIQVTVTDDLIAESEAALGEEEESYFVMLDTVLKQVVWVIRKGKRHGLQL